MQETNGSRYRSGHWFEERIGQLKQQEHGDQQHQRIIRDARVREECGPALPHHAGTASIINGSAPVRIDAENSSRARTTRHSKGKQRAMEPLDENLQEVLDARQVLENLKEDAEREVPLRPPPPRPSAEDIDDEGEGSSPQDPRTGSVQRELEHERQSSAELEVKIERQDNVIKGLQERCRNVREQQEHIIHTGHPDEACIWERRYHALKAILDETKLERDELQQKLDAAKQKIEDLKNEIQALKSERRDRDNELASVERGARRTQGENQRLNQENENLQRRLRRAQRKLARPLVAPAPAAGAAPPPPQQHQIRAQTQPEVIVTESNVRYIPMERIDGFVARVAPVTVRRTRRMQEVREEAPQAQPQRRLNSRTDTEVGPGVRFFAGQPLGQLLRQQT